MPREVPLTFDAIDVYPQEMTPVSQRIAWPTTGTRREVSYSKTEQELFREIDLMGARSAVVQVAATHDSFRIDGSLKANARMEHPGVVLTVTTRENETLTFATDLYRNWRENLRAITLGLEGLRRLNRYGITQGGRQYTGWKALPPGGYTPPPQKALTVQEAVDVIARLGQLGETSADVWARWPDGLKRTALREAVRAAHPDSGGSDEDMQNLIEARKVLAV